MPGGRPRLTDEERKMRIKNKNAKYYQDHKENWYDYPCYKSKISNDTFKGCVIYKLKFPDNKHYIGVSKCFHRRLKEHEKIFGLNVEAEILIKISNTFPTCILNYLELLVIFYEGFDNCLNKYNIITNKDILLSYYKKIDINLLDENGKKIMEKILIKIENFPDQTFPA